MHFRTIYAFLLISTALLFPGCSDRNQKSRTAEFPLRIVSLSPGITETLFALGLGDKVIGVTSHCSFPPQTADIEKIGGYADANLERIAALRPDLVILSGEHERQRLYLERFGIPTLLADLSTCESLCASFQLIGKACGAMRTADSLTDLFKTRFGKRPADDATAPRVLVCVGRESPGAGTLRNVFIAGTSTFYQEVLRAAGGRNAFAASHPAYPKLSPEGILSLAPDMIIDVAPAMGADACSVLVRDWHTLPRLPAVERGMVFCIPEGYATVPGPRLLLLLDDMQRFIAAYRQGRRP